MPKALRCQSFKKNTKHLFIETFTDNYAIDPKKTRPTHEARRRRTTSSTANRSTPNTSNNATRHSSLLVSQSETKASPSSVAVTVQDWRTSRNSNKKETIRLPNGRFFQLILGGIAITAASIFTHAINSIVHGAGVTADNVTAFVNNTITATTLKQLATTLPANTNFEKYAQQLREFVTTSLLGQSDELETLFKDWASDPLKRKFINAFAEIPSGAKLTTHALQLAKDAASKQTVTYKRVVQALGTENFLKDLQASTDFNSVGGWVLFGAMLINTGLGAYKAYSIQKACKAPLSLWQKASIWWRHAGIRTIIPGLIVYSSFELLSSALNALEQLRELIPIEGVASQALIDTCADAVNPGYFLAGTEQTFGCLVQNLNQFLPALLDGLSPGALTTILCVGGAAAVTTLIANCLAPEKTTHVLTTLRRGAASRNVLRQLSSTPSTLTTSSTNETINPLQLQTDLNQALQKIERLKTANQGLTAQISELETVNERLTEKMTKLEKDKSHAQRLLQIKIQKLNKLQRNKKRNANNDESKEESKAESTQVTSKASLQQKIKSLKQRNEALIKSLSNTEFPKMQRKINTLKEENSKLKKQVKDLTVRNLKQKTSNPSNNGLFRNTARNPSNTQQPRRNVGRGAGRGMGRGQ
jgi:hypothetical protein